MLNYLFSIAAGAVGGIAVIAFFGGFRRRKNDKRGRRKVEFSKIVLSAVLLTYFAGFGFGAWAVIVDPSQLGVFLAYIGTPTTMAIGFYAWKAKAENVVKIRKANPDDTAPVDLNNIQP